LTNPELCGDFDGALLRATVSEPSCHFVTSQRWHGLLRALCRSPAFELRVRDHCSADEQLDRLHIAHLEVIERQIFRCASVFSGLPCDVDIPLSPGARRRKDGRDATLPASMKHRFVCSALNGTEGFHASHVVRTVHAFAPCLNGRTMPTPTMASRVTSSASSLSLSPSVRAGRCGKTRYRNSAVLSQTRTSTLSGSSSPNSR